MEARANDLEDELNVYREEMSAVKVIIRRRDWWDSTRIL
jgi:hypothetical protein